MTTTSTDTIDDIETSDRWAEWPDADIEIDDEAFAAAIARGRSSEPD